MGCDKERARVLLGVSQVRSGMICRGIGVWGQPGRDVRLSQRKSVIDG
jgi:hypothetical protein